MAPLPNYFRTCRELKDTFWPQTAAKIPALRSIISSHFESTCGELSLLSEGAYARAYETSLSTGKKLIVRVVLPVRDGLKTEAEVATMDLIRAKTTIPVPEVYLFCSTRDNPIGAEWIVMDFMPGERFIDCWDELSLETKQHTVEDLASIVSSLYDITSVHCGSLLYSHSLRNNQRAQRFGNRPFLPPTVESPTSLGPATIGPVNDLCFTERLFPAPFSRCGPFTSERAFLEAVAYADITETDERVVKHRRWPHEKVFEVYDRVRAEYTDTIETRVKGRKSDASQFHLSHGGLSDRNILLDSTTGRITGIIDWEVSGFRPAWLAAGRAGVLEDHSHSGEEGAADDDDEEECFCLERTFFEDPFPLPSAQYDDLENIHLREYFSAQLASINTDLSVHHEHGIELRAIFAALCEAVPGNVEAWIEKYHERRWDVSARGEFPFDINEWSYQSFCLWKSLHNETSPP